MHNSGNHQDSTDLQMFETQHQLSQNRPEFKNIKNEILRGLD